MKYIYNISNYSLKIFKDENPYKPVGDEIYISKEQAEQIKNNRDKKIIAFINSAGEIEFNFQDYENIETEEQRLARLRKKRETLLEAFDKWEKAVLRGREDDDSNIMLWYQGLLDLSEIVFDNVPERVKYYL